MADVTVEETVGAPPSVLYGLVSDVTRMGEWSPENTSCRWLGAATGPSVGARFKGTNRRGWRRWSTTCTVTDADPGRRFAFDVSSGPAAISSWSYEFVPVEEGTRVIESWTDRRAAWMPGIARIVMGVRDQAEHNRAGMRTTLAALRRAAETATAGST